MDKDKPLSEHDSSETPLEPTIDPADLAALRDAARQAGEMNPAVRRPAKPEKAAPTDETMPDPIFDEPTFDDGDSPRTPLEPTLDPADLEQLRAIAAESDAPRAVRPRAPIDEADTIPLVPTPAESSEQSDASAPVLSAPVLSAPVLSAPDSSAAAMQPLINSEAAATPAPEPPEAERPPTAPAPQTPDNRRMWQLVFPTCFLLAIVMLLANILPLVMVQWRRAEAHAEADAIYLRRRAELKAESEAASADLVALDSKAKLVSLGFRHVVAKVLPSVVNIANLKDPVKSDGAAKNPSEAERDRRLVASTIGSGVLIRPGYLLTNYHVVQGGDRLRVVFSSGRVVSIDAGAVLGDPATDLAVIKLPEDVSDALKEDMKQTVVFADSDKDVEVGDWSLAIGSPMGLRQTVTSGIISAKDRLIDKLDMVELLQTDAAINPGNSGGPLFDQLGRVVGINVALASENGVNRGIGFAIPSNTAAKIAEALIEHGEVVRGYLGISMEELPLEKAKLLGAGGAVVVTRVNPQDAGDKAGLQLGDVVVSYNQTPLQQFNSVRHLRQLIIDTPPGSDVPLEIYRNDTRHTLTAHVAKRPMFVR